MIKSLVEHKLLTNFLIIEDSEDECGQELFIAFLMNYAKDESISKIHLICYENHPEFYLGRNKILPKIDFNFFSDPINWNNKSTEHSDLELFFSNLKDLSKTVFLFDSVSFLVEFHGFCAMYRIFHYLKETAKAVVCLAHGDLFTQECLVELEFLSTSYLKLLWGNETDGCKIVDVIYKKPGGKVQKQRELVKLSAGYKVSSKVEDSEKIVKASSNVRGVIRNLTTFKLDLEMSESERKAKDELVLPYLRTEEKGSGTGEVVYHPEANDFEDDPDEDLDI